MRKLSTYAARSLDACRALRAVNACVLSASIRAKWPNDFGAHGALGAMKLRTSCQDGSCSETTLRATKDGTASSTPGTPQNQYPNQTASRIASAFTERRCPTVNGCTI